MNSNLVTWMLAGALAASVSWNLSRALGSAEESTPRETSASADCCTVDMRALSLSPEQCVALEGACDAACADAERLAHQADERFVELVRRLGAPEYDAAALQGLAREVGELRARSLEACIGSIVRVREVLSREQLENLLESCTHAPEKSTSEE